jgi:REP element-mobilizing transposase RayT
MAGTYSQIYVHIVFVVKKRVNLIPEENLEELFEYIAGIIRNKGQESIIVNGISNHIHAFIGMKPNVCISDIARDIKNNSTNFINKQKWTKSKFSWQAGFGAFSYGQSQIEAVFNYIKNQKSHHRKKTFRDEYLEFLRRFEIEFDDRYLFDWIESNTDDE